MSGNDLGVCCCDEESDRCPDVCVRDDCTCYWHVKAKAGQPTFLERIYSEHPEQRPQSGRQTSGSFGPETRLEDGSAKHYIIGKRHVQHYQSCNCLADSAVCCDPACPCKQTDPGRSQDSGSAVSTAREAAQMTPRGDNTKGRLPTFQPACLGCGRSWGGIEAGHGHDDACPVMGPPPPEADWNWVQARRADESHPGRQAEGSAE